jgi:hypothetical protein
MNVTLAKVKYRSIFGLAHHSFAIDKSNTFHNFLISKVIDRFLDINNIFDSIHAFVINDPTREVVWGTSPFLQIAQDNSKNYPVSNIGKDDVAASPSSLLVGSNWYAYDSSAWPQGLPKSLEDKRLVPGPS